VKDKRAVRGGREKSDSGTNRTVHLRISRPLLTDVTTISLVRTFHIVIIVMKSVVQKKKMLNTFLLVLFFIVIVSVIAQQGQNLRKRRKDRNRPVDLNNNENNGKLFNALSIHYPLNIFDPVNPRNWRKPGVYSAELEHESTVDKYYLDVARAQDQEDVWLYENWFYGVKNGIILESGALDGLIFSTSFMFEQFANWTAVHVGKLIIFMCYLFE
jgi:hypothetical protein